MLRLRRTTPQDYPEWSGFGRRPVLGNVDAGTALIDRHPDARVIIDYMGTQQPGVPSFLIE
jgi:hypothetical protein